ncbi:hypothetical protein RU10_13965 [Pseudomonas fluorescens]|uniref:Uncharacterized protein n=1 Tax=Pseudomonas fluorescens TaxID=294 RepID=A0AAE2AV18_PSEFL|nr:hypothetical protein RU10_13965 [Pseudomonas fluorescens]
MDSVKQIQVGVPQQYPPISPLSLWERVRVRGFLLLEVAQSIDQRLILLWRAHRYPQELRNPLLLEVPHDHALLTQLGRQPRRVMLGVRQK